MLGIVILDGESVFEFSFGLCRRLENEEPGEIKPRYKFFDAM